MGCGCGRNSRQENNNDKFLSRNKPPLPSAPNPNINPVVTSQITKNNPDIRKQICRGCQFSTKNLNGTFDNNARCRKASKSINQILRDVSFRCPIQRF